MSLGKMNTFIDIISTAPTKDAEGFATHGDTILASVRAYFEPKNSTEKWANMATFSTVNALFRFRKIPGVDVNPTFYIVSDSGRYRIVSVEDVRGRGIYVEVLAEKIEGSVK
jgi:head-tail adaptor